LTVRVSICAKSGRPDAPDASEDDRFAIPGLSGRHTGFPEPMGRSGNAMPTASALPPGNRAYPRERSGEGKERRCAFGAET